MNKTTMGNKDIELMEIYGWKGGGGLSSEHYNWYYQYCNLL